MGKRKPMTDEERRQAITQYWHDLAFNAIKRAVAAKYRGRKRRSKQGDE